MPDTTITKVDSGHSPEGKQGQKYLASGKSISMRLWDEGPISNKEASTREYETVGYVIEGNATLTLEGQKVELKAGDSWVVPKGANHTYEIKDHFKAIEATSPPAETHGRD